MKCSVVIRAYNEAGQIGRLFEGLAHQNVRELDVVVVDSGSTDDTVRLAEGGGARVVHIPSAEFSFGRSLNLGMEAARSELVVIASAHVRPVYPDWIECLLQPFADEKVAVVYGKQRGNAASRLSEQQIFRQWFPETDVQDQPNAFCNNANAAVRRSLWKRRGYDEALTGLEDVEWARWARAQGFRVHYSAHAEVIHVHTETPQRVYERYRREGMAFKRIFPEAHFSAYDVVRLTLSNIATDMREALAQRALWRNVGPIAWFRAMQFWGTYKGYRQSGPITQALRQTFYYPPAPAGGPAQGRDVRPIVYDEDRD